MREIKFRAWNRAAKRFTYFNVRPSIEFTQDNKVGMFLSTTDRVYLTPYEDPEQYTGLRDKNGVEIYEGDIVSDGKNKYVVAFYVGAWRLKINVNGDDWWKSLYRYVTDRKCEVIGNIYENPELLKNLEESE